MKLAQQVFHVFVTDRETGTSTEVDITVVTEERVLQDNDQVNTLLHRLVRRDFGPAFAITKVNRMVITEETIFDLPIDRN